MPTTSNIRKRETPCYRCSRRQQKMSRQYLCEYGDRLLSWRLNTKRWRFGFIFIIPVRKIPADLLSILARDDRNYPYTKEAPWIACAIHRDLPCDVALRKLRRYLMKKNRKLKATDFELIFSNEFPLSFATAKRADTLFISATRCGLWQPKKRPKEHQRTIPQRRD